MQGDEGARAAAGALLSVLMPGPAQASHSKRILCLVASLVASAGGLAVSGGAAGFSAAADVAERAARRRGRGTPFQPRLPLLPGSSSAPPPRPDSQAPCCAQTDVGPPCSASAATAAAAAVPSLLRRRSPWPAARLCPSRLWKSCCAAPARTCSLPASCAHARNGPECTPPDLCPRWCPLPLVRYAPVRSPCRQLVSQGDELTTSELDRLFDGDDASLDSQACRRRCNRGHRAAPCMPMTGPARLPWRPPSPCSRLHSLPAC